MVMYGFSRGRGTARARRIGEFRRRETLMFNGYAEEVAHMYEGMDLTKWI